MIPGGNKLASAGSGIALDDVQVMAFILCAHTHTHPVEDPTLTGKFQHVYRHVFENLCV